MAGQGTDTLPGGELVYLPLQGSSGMIGVLALLPLNPARIALPEQQRLLETFTSQIALALERVRLATGSAKGPVKNGNGAVAQHLAVRDLA